MNTIKNEQILFVKQNIEMTAIYINLLFYVHFYLHTLKKKDQHKKIFINVNITIRDTEKDPRSKIHKLYGL